MNTSAAMESPPRANLFGGAVLGAVVVIALALVGHKVVYGTFLQKPAAPVAPADDPTSTARAPVPFVVRANVANAVISFRGESLPLPADTQVTASEMNDYVEVTAPGYEGRRFWLKFDRARSLVVTLPAGSGIIDATYDETQVALGQAVPKPTQTEHTMGKANPQQMAAIRPAAPATVRHSSVVREAPAPTPTAAPASPVVTAPATPATPTPSSHARPELDKNPWGDSPGK